MRLMLVRAVNPRCGSRIKGQGNGNKGMNRGNHTSVSREFHRIFVIPLSTQIWEMRRILIKGPKQLFLKRIFLQIFCTNLDLHVIKSNISIFVDQHQNSNRENPLSREEETYFKRRSTNNFIELLTIEISPIERQFTTNLFTTNDHEYFEEKSPPHSCYSKTKGNRWKS